MQKWGTEVTPQLTADLHGGNGQTFLRLSFDVFLITKCSDMLQLSNNRTEREWHITVFSSAVVKPEVIFTSYDMFTL